MRKGGRFGNQSVCMQSSFIRHLCFNNNPWYARGFVSPPEFIGSLRSSVSKGFPINPKYNVGPSASEAYGFINHCEGSGRFSFGSYHYHDHYHYHYQLSQPLSLSHQKFLNFLFWNGKKSTHGWTKYWDLLFWND